VNVLGERNDAEDGVDVRECDAMLAIDNETRTSTLFMMRAWCVGGLDVHVARLAELPNSRVVYISRHLCRPAVV
jgi:hypothetical protein